MKDITLFLNESLIKEGLKDVTAPRKGSYIYILKDGDTKAQKVRIENVIKRPIANGYDKSFTYVAELADNEYGIKNYFQYRFSGINYSPKSVEAQRLDDNETYYFGIDAKSINEFVKADAGKKLEGILKKIEDLEKQLTEANEQKAKLEAKINNDITESLLEGKETLVKFKLFGDNAKNAYDKVSSLAQAGDIYFERIDDNTFRLKLKPGYNIDKIVAALDGLIDEVPEDKKEELQDKIDSLKNAISKAEEAVKPDETEEDKKEEE